MNASIKAIPLIPAITGISGKYACMTTEGVLWRYDYQIEAAGTKSESRSGQLSVENAATDFTRGYTQGQVIRCPVAHHDGNYFADAETLAAVEGNGQVAFRYAEGTNPNGSINNIAGVFNEQKNVLGLMPHPENLIEGAHGGTDGRYLFATLLEAA